VTNVESKDFWQKVRHEAEPIVTHAIVVFILEGCLLLIGLMTLLLEFIFPKQESYFLIIEQVDIWLALALLCLFGFYTLIRIGIRLTRAVMKEASEEMSKGKVV
jgi:hypothetical protein